MRCDCFCGLTWKRGVYMIYKKSLKCAFVYVLRWSCGWQNIKILTSLSLALCNTAINRWKLLIFNLLHYIYLLFFVQSTNKKLLMPRNDHFTSWTSVFVWMMRVWREFWWDLSYKYNYARHTFNTDVTAVWLGKNSQKRFISKTHSSIHGGGGVHVLHIMEIYISCPSLSLWDSTSPTRSLSHTHTYKHIIDISPHLLTAAHAQTHRDTTKH